MLIHSVEVFSRHPWLTSWHAKEKFGVAAHDSYPEECSDLHNGEDTLEDLAAT